MNHTRPLSAKIIQHAEGLGAPTAEQVRQRARELAQIGGRSEFNEEDWREAKRELHGGSLEQRDQEEEMSALVSGHDMVAGSLGRHVENVPIENSESVSEELVAEGMDEAAHEQMLMASRENVEPED